MPFRPPISELRSPPIAPREAGLVAPAVPTTSLPQVARSTLWDLAPGVPANDQIVPAPAKALGFANKDPSLNAPFPQTAWSESERRLQREQKATTADYAGSIWRQDGVADGLMGYFVGKQMMPDPNYSPFTDPNWNELTRGIAPELQNNLYQAHSAAHAQYISARLRQKQEDLTRLEDMGWKGELGRFALNAVMPEQLLMGIAGGWALRGAGTAARLLKGPVGRAIGEAADFASTNAAAGVSRAVAENVAFEKMRQSVNFEDDSGQLVGAGLMAAMLGSGFSVLGAHATRSAQRAATKELDALGAIRTANAGAALSPEQSRTVTEVHAAHSALSDFQAGKLDESGLEKAMAEFHGPVSTAEQWSQRQGSMDDLFAAPHAASDLGEALKGNAVAARTARAESVRKLREESDLISSSSDKAAVDAQGAIRQAEQQRDAAHVAETERTNEAFSQARMVSQEDPLLPPQQAAPGATLQGPPQGAPSAVDSAMPAPHPHEAYVGRDVSWAGSDGETIYGNVKSFDPKRERLAAHTADGPVQVHASQIDTFDHQHAPSGFLPQSVGAGQTLPVDSIGPAWQRTALAEKEIGGLKVPLRFDIYSVLNGSPVMAVRELAYKLVKDAIQNDSAEAQAMTASEWKKQLQRTIAGQFHSTAREAYMEARSIMDVPVWRTANFAHEFYSLVSRVTRGDPDALQQFPRLAGPLKKASAAQAKVAADLLAQLKAAGVKGAEDIQPNDFYVNRMWHQGQIHAAVMEHGAESVHRLIASSIQNPGEIIDRYRKRPGMQHMTDDEILMEKARGFLQTVRSLEYSPALHEIAIAGRDMGTLRRELNALGVPESHVDDLVDLLFEVRPHDGDAGRAANLKFRFALDETGSVNTPAGVLRMTDLFENDARVLVDAYTSSLAGHVGLAKVGIRSQAEWAQAVKAAAEEASANATIDGNRVAKDMKLLNDVHKNILGRPINEDSFSATARAAAALRGYTRGVMLPQLGIAAAFEMNKAIAMVGFKSLIQQLPSFRSLLVAMRQGYIPDKGLARDIMLISGFGHEKASSYYRAQEIENGFLGQSLTRAEAGAGMVSHAVDVLSGNASFTSLTKQLTGMMTVQNMHDYAAGLKVLTPKLRERWVGQGINDADIEKVLGKLKEHSTDRHNVLQEIRYEDWLKDSPKTYEQFQTFLSRQVRDAIQDHDLGETMPFMHSTLGKVFAELKTFFLVAHAKNFLKQLHYMDSTAAQIWAIGFIGESLAYMTQSAINYPTELDKKLEPEQIARAAFFRMSAMGTASLLAETGYNILSGGESLVQPGMTANTDNRSFINTPSMVVTKRLLNLPATSFGLLTGNNVTTRQEGQDLWGAIPGGNLYALKAAGQWWTHTLPKVDPAHPSQR